MSYMAYTDHIAITSGDKSTTRREVSVAGCPVAPWFGVTQGDSSDTYRRIGRDSEILPGEFSSARKATTPAGGARPHCISSPTDTVGKLSRYES
jgi:hypothetical protein